MPNLPTRLRWALLLILAAQTVNAQTVDGLAGQWVMKLGDRVFLVLELSTQKDPQRLISGWLARPQHFQSGNGTTFSHISKVTIRQPITHSELKDGRVSITVQNSDNASDIDTYQPYLADTMHLKLKMVGIPFEPFTFTKTTKEFFPANDWEEEATYLSDDSASNAEMQRIFDEDQRVRQPGLKIDWDTVSKSDQQRRDQTRKLLDKGELHSGEDFEHAAFVFQHGSSPNDYLVGHILAMVAVSQGRSTALWIASATLDRYLQASNRPQVLGTQFFIPPNDLPTTQEPYDRSLIADSLRRFLGVPSQAEQDEQRKQYDAGRKRPN